MEFARLALIAGSGIFLLLGAVHGLLTLRDLRNPTNFTPTDPAVREAMEGARLAIHPHANIWKAWIGFNLSHSLGLLLFGGTVWIIAWDYFPVFISSLALRGLLLSISTIYLVMSIRFWFARPTAVIAAAMACYLVAALTA